MFDRRRSLQRFLFFVDGMPSLFGQSPATATLNQGIFRQAFGPKKRAGPVFCTGGTVDDRSRNQQANRDASNFQNGLCKMTDATGLCSITSLPAKAAK
jgi:hypothetical protein